MDNDKDLKWTLKVGSSNTDVKKIALKSKITILDANITTIIAAIILFIFGSGPVKGFSITLCVGILTTLFSVFFIARLLTSIYVKINKNKEIIIK